MRRIVLLALALLAFTPTAAHAGDGFFVGVDEDAAKWGKGPLVTSLAQSLGVKALHVTVPWKAGQKTVPNDVEVTLDRLVMDTWGLRLVVSVYGSPADAPRRPDSRAAYCSFIGDLLKNHPTINDIVIWNDPNDSAFWSPQFAQGKSVAASAYEALLATCWDQLHAQRPAVNLVALAVSHTTDATVGFLVGSHTAADWWRRVGLAYRASKRQAPIFDTVGEIPHPDNSSDRPWLKHADTGSLGLGDYDRLMAGLTAAFGGTKQPLPGQAPVSIWYLAQGFQTIPDPAKASLYTGSETDHASVPAWSLSEAADTGQGQAPDQAFQIEDAVRAAYCQPAVGAYFNFHLADESDLAGYQTGVLWADWTPKPAYAALHTVTDQVNAKTIDCAAFGLDGAPPRPAAVAPVGPPLAIQGLHATSVGSNAATVAWTTTEPATVKVAYGLPATGATLWAAPDGSAATLGGLTFGTTYRVWLTAVADDGQRASAWIDLRSGGAPAIPHSAATGGRLTVDGQPWFPYMVWGGCSDTFNPGVASGINLFAYDPCGGLPEELSGLAGRAFTASAPGEENASTNGLLGYFYPDEADGLGMSGPSLPKAPGGIPSFLTLTNHFYSQAAPLPNGKGMYPGLIARADVVGFDLYPLQEWCRADTVGDVFNSQQELVHLAAPRPTFQWIEADTWKCHSGNLVVTPAVVQAESWLAIAGGAQGLGYFPAYWSPTIGKAILGVTQDVPKLLPVLSAPWVDVQSTKPIVRVGARTLNGATYVIAVNSGFSAVQTTIKTAGLGTQLVSVMDENRRVATTDGAFTDNFAPLAVHVYVAAPLP